MKTQWWSPRSQSAWQVRCQLLGGATSVFAYRSVLRYNVQVKKASITQPATPLRGAAAQFVESKLAAGAVVFSLDELVKNTGLSIIAARNQLLRLGNKVVRVSPRQQFFLIVRPDHQVMGGPPVEWWLDAYFRWLGRPYYLALQTAAASHGSSPQAIQVTQVMTDVPRRDLRSGRIRVHC